MSTSWRNRIVGEAEVAPDQLLAHPSNFRTHPGSQAAALRDILRQVGWVQRIIVNRRTGHILDGHLRVDEARKAWAASVPVLYVDLAADEERVILATLDPLAAMAETDAAQLDALLREVTTESPAVMAMLDALAQAAGVAEDVTPPAHRIQGHGHGYDFRDIHPLKLAYRVEAAWRADDGVAIDCFSGQGQLAAWYQRRFTRVIRVDTEPYDGIDVVSDAETWLQSDAFRALASEMTFVDFDDEGSPLRAVRTCFAQLPATRDTPFVLCLTDGSGLNLKVHGKFAPDLYALPGSVRRATTADYDHLEDLVGGAVQRMAAAAGWTAALWSTTRGSEGNVCYQTFGVTRA